MGIKGPDGKMLVFTLGALDRIKPGFDEEYGVVLPCVYGGVT